MSSSTSSSRAIFFRIFVTMVLGMTAALASVRLTTYLNDATSDNFLGRVMEAQRALPRIVEESEDLVLFFGSSMVQAGFSPREFDAWIAEGGGSCKSFNFGFGGLNPLFQDYLSRRIRDEFQAGDRRLKLALIEFNPFQTTLTRRAGAREIEDSFVTLLGTDEELLEITRQDLDRGVRLFTMKYFRDSVSAEMITSFFAQGFQPPRRRTEIEEDEEVREKFNEAVEALNRTFEEDYPDYDGSDWTYDWQGGGTIAAERSEEALAAADAYYTLGRHEYYMDNDRINRVTRADILDLNFDEELVDAFIRIVRNFQEFSDEVEVMLLPKNSDWIRNPPEALARQRAVLERIHRETGVTIRDWQHHESITPEMFNDTTHLARYTGGVAFSRALAETYAETLDRPLADH